MASLKGRPTPSSLGESQQSYDFKFAKNCFASTIQSTASSNSQSRSRRHASRSVARRTNSTRSKINSRSTLLFSSSAKPSTTKLLYKLNPFIIKHNEICTIEPTVALPYDANLLEHLALSDTAEPFNAWTICSSFDDEVALLNAFNRDAFPKLKSIKVSFDNTWTSWATASANSEPAGMELELTAMDQFQVMSHLSGITVEFEHPMLVMAWQYISNLSPDDLAAIVRPDRGNGRFRLPR